ncbi:putative two-component system response regulator [Actinoplanes missouriensis 431]|uniref:Putative two-component system response regulator n=1 Tax=Actinoplanes missouriensis (strain ATCC 14538 / DSM 43046 / CBS 188.64 / JCM 3121 / NBRC 102363 / NCIMB 12654 / NRRL B-3342 / UNCC 431) TaxID=512565 RepID=I0H720_ACTM4|nr:response regulator transcription factor [Actinoplanes missouriensis]BAL88807.1 putative two-component system response regulator [Actinoplanes missouriensis 431]
MIRVLLADDQALMRAGFRALLDAEEGLEVVGECGDGAAAVDMAGKLRPDVVLMDVQMPGMDGIEATRRINADPGLAGVRVLILTNYELSEYVFASLRAGASGFLLKDADPATLLQAITTVARGEALLAPTVTRTLISEFVSSRPPGDPAAGRAVLTAREQEIVELVGRGLTNDEIADQMVISPLTAKTHVNRAMIKLHCHDRAQLVVWAYESGLIAPRRRSAERG